MRLPLSCRSPRRPRSRSGSSSAPSAPVLAPRAVDLTSVGLGEYASPTDYLLDPYGVDVSESLPSLGCDDSTLGCPSLDDESDTEARSTV